MECPEEKNLVDEILFSGLKKAQDVSRELFLDI